MRLTHVTGGPNSARHLFPASRMSLLKNSNEKLDQLVPSSSSSSSSSLSSSLFAMQPRDQLLPTILFARAQRYAAQVYERSEPLRRHGAQQFRRNSFRFALSFAVLVTQIIWFAAVHFEASPNLGAHHHHHQQQQQRELTMEPIGQCVTLWLKGQTDPSGIDRCEAKSHTGIAQEAHNQTSEKRKKLRNRSAKCLAHTDIRTSGWRQTLGVIAIFMQRIIALFKLALVMLAFEAIRAGDTVWSVIVGKEQEGDKQNASKSPVDTAYIERNRAYK